MQVRLCDKYGFDKTGRQQRLALFRLGEEQEILGQLLHDTVIQPAKHDIVGEFYDFLQGDPQLSRYIGDASRVEKLKITHTLYLESLGMEYDTEPYFENRLEVGLAHERIGLPLSLYLSSYQLLQQILISHIPPDLEQQDRDKLTRFIIQIAGLDMSLATDIYHRVQVENLTSSINGLLIEEQRLSSQVKVDTLTGAASREHLFEILETELQSSQKRAMATCLAMIDLDHFKDVNDNYGHLVGDEILKGVVGRIKSRMRNLDVIGRYGGEEFMLIFPSTSKQTAIEVVERIRKHVADGPFHVDEMSIPVTISAGVTTIAKGDTMDSLLKRVDDLLYKAKNNGRNRVES